MERVPHVLEEMYSTPTSSSWPFLVERNISASGCSGSSTALTTSVSSTASNNAGRGPDCRAPKRVVWWRAMSSSGASGCGVPSASHAPHHAIGCVAARARPGLPDAGLSGQQNGMPDRGHMVQASAQRLEDRIALDQADQPIAASAVVSSRRASWAGPGW